MANTPFMSRKEDAICDKPPIPEPIVGVAYAAMGGDSSRLPKKPETRQHISYGRANPYIRYNDTPENFDVEFNKIVECLNDHETSFEIDASYEMNSAARSIHKQRFRSLGGALSDFAYWLNAESGFNRYDPETLTRRKMRLMSASKETKDSLYVLITEWPYNIFVSSQFDTSSYDRLAQTFYNHFMLPAQMRSKKPLTDVKMSECDIAELSTQLMKPFNKDQREENLRYPPENMHTVPMTFVQEMADYLMPHRLN